MAATKRNWAGVLLTMAARCVLVAEAPGSVWDGILAMEAAGHVCSAVLVIWATRRI